MGKRYGLPTTQLRGMLAAVIGANLIGAGGLVVYWDYFGGHFSPVEQPAPNTSPDSGRAEQGPCANWDLDGIHHGVHGKDSSMPVITAPGELGPPSTGWSVCGTDWHPAYPGSNVWLPDEQLSGKLFVQLPGSDMQPPDGYEEIRRTPDGAVLYWMPTEPAPEHP